MPLWSLQFNHYVPHILIICNHCSLPVCPYNIPIYLEWLLGLVFSELKKKRKKVIFVKTKNIVHILFKSNFFENINMKFCKFNYQCSYPILLALWFTRVFSVCVWEREKETIIQCNSYRSHCWPYCMINRWSL